MPLDLHDIEANRRFRNFNWEKTRSFYIIAKMGSFSNAATFLHISQSGLSRQITELEKALETSLFIRVARGVKLTRKGKELFSIVEANFLNMKGFTHNIHAETNQSKKRKIRIAATHADAAYILNDLILDYNKQHPNLTFELVSDDQMIDVVLSDVDIAIRPLDPKAYGVKQEFLFNLEKELFASPEYLKKYGEPKTVEDLKNHHIIAPAHIEDYPYAELNWVLSLGMPQGKLRDPIYTSTSIECLIQAAEKDMGIIASYEKMKIVRDSNLKKILPGIRHKEKDGYFIYPEFLGEDKDIIEIKDYLKERLR